MKPILGKQTSSFYPTLKEDTERLHFAMVAAGVGIWELKVETNTVSWDDRCRELFGLAKENNLPYEDAIKCIHPDDLDEVNAAAQLAMSGEEGGKFDIRYRTIGGDDKKLRWVHFSGQAYFDENGKLNRFGGIAQDVTDYTLALLQSEKALQESESRFRAMISSAPVGIGLFVGRDLIIDMPNQMFIDIVGKGPDIAGKPLRNVMPELQNQPFLQILDEVYTSGEMFQSSGSPVSIVKNGIMTNSYYNIAFTPLSDSEGKIYAILDISVDVTEATKSRQKLEEAQRILEDALEMAQLATWSIDAVSGRTQYSERMKLWLGVSESGRTIEKGIESLPRHDRKQVAAAIQWAMNPESGGLFDLEYGIIDQVTGRERIIHAKARTFFDAENKPLKLVGTALDVTQQRNTRLALEHEVQERTEELDAANEELRATNEEFQTINEELAQLNDALEQSNESLQQFAHVASHDLKEPVRKIKIFLGMIEADQATVLSSNAKVLIERVNTAANRMFSMINGVLVYSTVNAKEHPVDQVNLQKIIEQIIIDLEMIIAQKNATIHYKDLPVIEGAEILLYQLFSNLIINSLKFSNPGIAPVIEVSALSLIKNRNRFVEIKVADNGVGFESNQSEKIFQTFARLHSKDKYEGTGLGLSLCQKIARQHGGSIEASGKIGEGAQFTILLPLRQSHNMT